MHKLIEFIRNHKHWFLFIVLELVALFLLFSSSMIHRSVALFSGNYVVGNISATMTKIQSYLHLREANRELLEENARLERSYLTLKRYINDHHAYEVEPGVRISDSTLLHAMDSSLLPTDSIMRRNMQRHWADSLLRHRPRYQFKTARVVSANRSATQMFYIIDKGSVDGLAADMPVMSDKGVVGILARASAHYSVVIPLTNPSLKLSCCLAGTGYTGTLVRTEKRTDLLTLTDLPLHAPIHHGDTIVTSGYSYIFPENLVVGVVQIQGNRNADKRPQRFSSYAVHPVTDFDRLNYVYVILNQEHREARQLEQEFTDHAENPN